MGGKVSFRDALEARLRLIQPTADLLRRFLGEHPFHLTPGVSSVVGALQRRGIHVFLVSGGFTQMIAPVALELGIPSENVFANTILFDARCVKVESDACAWTC
jgi:phosphoserine phosphatase